MRVLKQFRSGIPSSQITPESIYLSRRALIKAGLMGLSSAALAACASPATPAPTRSGNEAAGVATTSTGEPAGATSAPAKTGSGQTAVEGSPTTSAEGSVKAPLATTADGIVRDELGDPVNSFEAITTYNNFYEFTTDKEAVAAAAANFKTSPWTLSVGGLVNAPKTFDLDMLLKDFGVEERVYRLRCVEGWSMVIPWQGFMLNKLLKAVEPKAEAKYVRFETLNDPAQFPGTRDPFYTWPYAEGLRLDEAMHDLTLMATGLYGKPMPPQNGAPIRLAVPWKYGFKSIKSIVKIELVAEEPTSLWMSANPDEYGFYSNVNPKKSHPRWSQATERRIGEFSRRPTPMFNGYEKEVAALYAGMDLNTYY